MATMTKAEWTTAERRVYNWAVANRPDDVWYGTRYSYWVAAKAAGVCTSDEYDYAERVYDSLWNYRGD